ncbi:MAG TPA: TonB-dependent receptor plug domain-containing protein, partial [Gemmatimonadaceae bacterium]|nr:TonB-dependent receptor plug domain-containing protein [Gemmatimonadaceae bacterium]
MHAAGTRQARHLAVATLATLATLVALPLAAQEGRPRQPADTAADSASRRLPPVVTTATRYPAPVSELPQRVEVIRRVDLERTPALDPVDALKKLASVDVVQYPGLLGGVGVRGFRPQTGGINQRSLVLIDGRPAGAYNLALVDLAMVERIDVLKGPASALYGASAMGGVVSLTTRRSSGRPTGAVSASYGSFATTEYALRAGGTLVGALDGDVALRYYAQSDDYRMGGGHLLRDLVGSDSARKLYAPESAQPSRLVADVAGDGERRRFTTYLTRSAWARLGYTAGGVRVDARGELFDADDVLAPGDLYARGTPFPGDLRKDLGRRSADVALSADRGRHAPLARVFAAEETASYYDTPDAAFAGFRTDDVTWGAQLQDVVRLGPRGDQAFLAGLDVTAAEATSRFFLDPTTEAGTFSPNSNTRAVGAFAEAHLRSSGGRVVGTLGARVDRVALELEATPYRPDVTAGEETFGVV